MTRNDGWRPVEAPPTVNGDLSQVLASVDALQQAWADVVAQASPEEFRTVRARSLRRHAIETGVIERLYDVDWGVTRALVAEGLSAQVAAREGGIDEVALGTITAQFEALEMLAGIGGPPGPDGPVLPDLSVSLVRQVHAALCRTQATFPGTDQFGRTVRRQLRHGTWKEQPNHVVRSDGSVHAFCPPLQVPGELERLVRFHDASGGVHPVVRAAWLHHALVSIHPFDDGNGRVARALTMLVLLRARYAPLVVGREDRGAYIAALESASDGDLRDLVRLFARLEIVALRAEIDRPARPADTRTGAGPVRVAQAYAQRLLELRDEAPAGARAVEVKALADALLPRIEGHLTETGRGLAEAFRTVDPDVRPTVGTGRPGEEQGGWWRHQLVTAARDADFWANLAGGTWWASLRMTVLGHRLRYVAALQKVGRGETGVLALTVFAESAPETPSDEADGPRRWRPLLRHAGDRSVTLVRTDAAEERWPEVRQVLDASLEDVTAAFAEALV